MPLDSKQPPSTMLFTGNIEITPIGSIWVIASEKGLVLVEFGGTINSIAEKGKKLFAKDKQTLRPQNIEVNYLPDHPIIGEALRQIEEYLQGRRHEFDLPIEWSHMPAFQRRVLQATYAIPYGKTATYSDVARLAGRPKAARAAGRAEATNPIPLVIPCHRVVGSDGKLHGYGGPGGIELKARLLKMEQEKQL